ncbi:MAG: hypothetical protein GY802_11615 [Gammaproteobacteria bacterium]|nr:hypothetical protein [Gammaproteobacteria bacterium]
MMISILSLATAYVFLLFLVLLAILKSEVGAGLKIVLIVLSLGFYLWHYSALQQYPGWPADDALPTRFELISSYTVEPDHKHNEDGAIYIWIRDLEANRSIPRSYRLPYLKALHRKVDDTLRRQREGERFVGSPIAGGEGARSSIEFEALQRDTGSHKSSLQ